MTSPASSKRPLWTIVAALLLGAAALWGASHLVWSAHTRDAGVRGIVLETRTGAEISGALIPLALLALAGVAGMIATGGWPRRALGAVLAIAGLAACWVAVDGMRWSGYPAGAPLAQILAGRGLAAFGGILVTVGGLLAVKRAANMPRLGARYSAPSVKKTARDSDAELWEALSEGDDPTTDR
ncbi:MAG TPA: Trp biosynthesis-associated membrane protein [Amycolatopsis sp.]|uniref:Trp biosynthesis-associated membrane protein n=1 Tax=Amycolatopsis sp. TaxID=37632 RepID=UPI002B45AA70|nr:Trp biosynthesis-associated membrane protein [Amycolatopsis sp.]HKS48753.1 Trp biosynthesis-associated membrane protein [Amycolatopsis sp.]